MSVASDATAFGLLGYAPEPLRYEEVEVDPSEVSGLLNSLLPSDARVLDVGCGTGSMTIAANRGKNNTIVAIEPEYARAAAATERGLNVYNGILDQDFVNTHEQFDAITFADVLEHLIDPPAALEVARTALKPSGVLLASVPNVAHWTVRLRLLVGKFEYDRWGIMDVTHLRWFTRKSLVQMIERQGFQVTDIYPSAGNFLDDYKRFPFSIFPQRLRRRIIKQLAVAFPGTFACQNVVRAVMR